MQHKALMTLCWSLLLLVPGSSGFMEDLQEVFTDAKEYIKGAVPYVKELYSTVERAYEVYNHLIDEECDFDHCGPGLAPVSDPSHVPSSDGCGAVNMLFDDSDASPVRLDPRFADCCDDHDHCYDTCNSDRDLCDLRFRRCLYRVCSTLESKLFEQDPCKAKARAAFLLVQGLGCPLYRDAQRNACMCVRKRRKVSGRDEL